MNVRQFLLEYREIVWALGAVGLIVILWLVVEP